jgi:hypothetical protein
MKSSIPDKYLNNNVRAMVSGGLPKSEIKPEQEKIPESIKKPILHLNTVFSFFRKNFRLEVKFTKEEQKEKEHDGSN